MAKTGGVAVVANEENWDMVRDIVRKLKGTVMGEKAND